MLTFGVPSLVLAQSPDSKMCAAICPSQNKLSAKVLVLFGILVATSLSIKKGGDLVYSMSVYKTFRVILDSFECWSAG